MQWARVRAVAALPLAAVLGLGAGCGRPRPTIPDGVTVVREEPPPPPVVAEAQRLLQQRGFYVGEVDGALTPATRVALAKLQRERGLEPTGELDAATLATLGLEARSLRRVRRPPREEELPQQQPGPTPAPPLEAPSVPERPQPPPGALDGARDEARRFLALGAGAAPPLPSPEQVGIGSLAPAAREMARTEAALHEARATAFERLLLARAEGGWALLPQELIEALEAALARRSLLVHGPDGRLGPDDEAAIRWLEGSLGLPPSGRPGLRLLEALGIDPSPMFAP